ncbi:MAG: DUF4157 domain-containing protein [bacterium]
MKTAYSSRKRAYRRFRTTKNSSSKYDKNKYGTRKGMPIFLNAKNIDIGDFNDRSEQHAERFSEKVMQGDSTIKEKNFIQTEPVSNTMSSQTDSQPGGSKKNSIHFSNVLEKGGQKFEGSEQRFFESRIGKDLSHVRVHNQKEDGLLADALGARAFAYGNHIYLGSNEKMSDRWLMAHELGHLIQEHPNINLREATWLERRAWLSFFDHYLPRKFLNNYMDDTGNPITLTPTEMADCNPIVDLKRSSAFRRELASLLAVGGGTQYLDITGWGGALTNGTLGNFTIHYSGILTVSPDGSWVFNGFMWFEDYWDFNPGGANRPLSAELKVLIANVFLPGRPFLINSALVPVMQTSEDSRATWGAHAPVHVPDRAARTGADIEVGAESGGATFGEIGEVGGSEVGAQSSEDFNP